MMGTIIYYLVCVISAVMCLSVTVIVAHSVRLPINKTDITTRVHVKLILNIHSVVLAQYTDKRINAYIYATLITRACRSFAESPFTK